MRFDASMESLVNIGRSESFAELNNSDFGLTRSFMSSSGLLLLKIKISFSILIF